MNALNLSLRFEALDVRILGTPEAPLFVASDVCRALEIANGSDAVERLDSDEKGVVTADTLGGPQQVRTVTEPGLYRLVMTSRKPAARRFQRWVVHEVLPTIRKTGGYGAPDGLSVAVQALTAALAPLIERVSRVEQLVVQGHSLPAQAFIPGTVAKRTSRAITALARLQTSGRPSAFSSARATIEYEFRHKLGFPSLGCNRWANFPLSRASELLAAVEGLERQAERLTPPPQQALPFPRPA